jgi:hypothetical protein
MSAREQAIRLRTPNPESEGEMSKTPEELAAAVFEKIIEGDSYDNFGSADVPALIASAIREAENETLENAALWCDGEAKTPSSAGAKAAGRREAGRRLGRVLRHIKHKET